jgi:hypothetical protein
VEQSGWTAPTVPDDPGSPAKRTKRAWFVATAIGVVVALAASFFLAFVGVGSVVAWLVGFMSGVFIAGRRLRVHGVGPWIGVGLAVFVLQWIVSFVILATLIFLGEQVQSVLPQAAP